MSAEQAPKRRSSSVIKNSKYAPVRPPEDERRHWIESLGQDPAANERAKEDIAAMSRQQGGRARAQVQLDDIEVQQRRPRYTVGTPAPLLSPAPTTGADASPQPADTAESSGERATSDQLPPASKELATQKAAVAAPKKAHANAIPPASRTTFAHIEHPPARSVTPARNAPIAQSASYARGEYYAPVGTHPTMPDAYPHWDTFRKPAFGQPIVLLLVALVCGAVIWMFFQSPKTFISSYGAPAWSAAVSAAANQAFGNISVAAGEHSVIGAPSINAAAIDTILSNYGSPAAGTGQAWVKLGQQYGIDPAYAVAFFIHESSAGTNPGWAGMKPDGSTTHNVGNIICAGYATCYGRFRDYPSWDEGIADWYKLISSEYVSGRGAASVEQIIPIYAPSSDNNDVPGYINVVVTMVDSWRRGVLR